MKYPEEHANTTVWQEEVTINGMLFNVPVTYTVLDHREANHWCGYVRFPHRPLIEGGYKGIATYIPVHGGITYAENEGKAGMVYGFDCAHAGDDKNEKTRDMQWLMQECRNMAIGILLAARYERHYLLAKTEKEKATVVDKYHADLKENYHIEFNLKDNFGAMINVLFGGL